MRETPLQLDLKAILRERVPRRIGRWIPGFLVGGLERLICQNGLNSLLRSVFPAEGSAFSAGLLRELDIKVEVCGLENLRGRKRLVFASNHPLGGMDGITLVKMLGEAYGDENVRVLVNDMLMHVEPLAGVFLPINKYGAQARGSARKINETYAGTQHICVFPAGLVSRLGADGTVRDLEWQKAFVAKALEYDRAVVPVRFEALNAMSFYRFARLRKRLGLKVNIEQALLPRQIFNARGKRFRVVFGEAMEASELRSGGKSATAIAAEIRDKVYSL